MGKKHSYEYVYNYFKEQQCKLLESKYINSKTKMKYRCLCGNISYIKFNDFQQGHLCSNCGINKVKIKLKHTYEYIKSYIELYNYKIITKEYFNSRQPLLLICNNNHEYICNFNNFKKGHRCSTCYFINNSGENHYRYIFNREELKLNERIRLKRSKQWIKNNLQKDLNYNNFLLNPDLYVIDHIIPISIFIKLFLYYNIEEKKLKQIINSRENLQLLTKENNRNKYNNGCLFTACQFLMLNNIKLLF